MRLLSTHLTQSVQHVVLDITLVDISEIFIATNSLY